MKHILLLIAIITCIVYVTTYRFFYRDNLQDEVQESNRAIMGLSFLYTLLIMALIIVVVLFIF